MTTPHITCLHELSGHTDRVWCVTWSPNGKLLATCGGDHTIRLWSTSTYTPVATLSDGHKRTVRSVTFHPSGTKLASASFDGTTIIWERNQWDSEWESVATLEGHENEVKSVSFSIGGSLLATSSRDKTIWLWEVEEDNDFDCLAVLSDHEQDVKYVQWHPHEDILASASYDDTIKVFEEVQSADEWQCTQTFSGHTSTVWCLAWDPTGAYLASASDDCTVKIWSRQTGKCLHTFGPFSRTLYAVSWTIWQGRGYIVAVGADDMIRIFAQEEDDWQLACQLEAAHASDINSVAWRPQGGTPLCPPSSATEEGLLFATTSDDGVVKVWQYHPA